MPQVVRKVDPLEGLTRRSVQRGSQFWPRSWQTIDQQIIGYWKITESYPWRDAWMLEHKNKLLTLQSAGTTLWLGKSTGRVLNMSAKTSGSFAIYMPAIVGSVILGILGHTLLITQPMMLNPDRNPMSLILGSGALQIGTGFLYPLVFTTGSSIYMALRLNTFPIPDDLVLSRASRSYLYENVIKKSAVKNWRGLLIGAVINFTFASGFAWYESVQMRFVYHTERQNFQQSHGDHVEQQAEQAIKASEGKVVKPPLVEAQGK